MADGPVGASFRDPAGFVFRYEGVIYRQVNAAGAEDYDALMASGLYERLADRGALVAHAEVASPREPGGYRTLRPEPVDFVSYPYEWCFSQLRDAALETLRIQREALECDMSLKDASAYNIQFHRGRPVLIDTLSFERYRRDEPWVAYRQFCQHFLAPLALMSQRDVRLSQLLRVHIDGIPLDLASSLLPWTAWLKPSLLLNLRLHARSQSKHARDVRDGKGAPSVPRISKKGLTNLVTALESGVRALRFEPEESEWSDYDAAGSYEEEGLVHKRELVSRFVAREAPQRVWDLGANTGDFSRLASEHGAQVVAFDVDPGAVERNYRRVRSAGEVDILPLWIDLANPSPALGWAHAERASLVERGRADLVLALALVHHLAISHNLPLGRISRFMASLADALVIEFVPKGDARVDTLLATRPDIFPDYTREGFERAFSEHWEVVECEPIASSDRVLYRMRARRGDSMPDLST